CRHKAEVVAEDERESGQRALLNLGHTFGHAIETASGYGQWLHGEAVGVGMLMAATMSERLGWIDASDVRRVEGLLDRANLPVRAPAVMSADDFRRHMAVDKKVTDGRIRLVLLEALGSAKLVADYSQALLDEVLQNFPRA
ncbi:MAG: 3-dehydroquinate synthase family protein, partial [Arenicellales bacterium]